MAGTVSVVIADDLGGSPGARAVAVSFDGRSCQIDLGKKDRVRFRKSSQPLTEPAAGLLSAGRRELPGIPVRAWPGGGACLGRGAGPERIGARPDQRRGDERIRHCSQAAVAPFSRAGEPAGTGLARQGGCARRQASGRGRELPVRRRSQSGL